MSEAGEVDITFFIDELEFRAFKPALSRPDVTEVYPWLPHAANCGFSEQINLAFLNSGAHTLTLVAKNAKGYSSECKQDFYLLKGNQLYSAWLKYKLCNDQHAAIGKALSSDQFVVHIIVYEGLDNSATLATLNSIAVQDWGSWKVHYLGKNWQEIQRSLLPEIRSALQEKTDVAASLFEILQSVNLDRDYLLGLNGGELLFPFAIRELIACAEAKGSDLVYSDHDTLNSDDIHVDPVFTFGWSPDHVMSRNYVGDLYLVRAGKISPDFISTCKPSDWRYGLLLHIGNCSDKIHRVASILWSTTVQAGEILERRLRDETVVLEKYLSQLEPLANLTVVDGYRYIEWPIAGEPRVSIIIPTMAKLDLIKPCLDSLTAITAYKNYEILMLDNSRGRNPDGIAYLHDKKFEVIECDEAFNWSRLNNIGARRSRADYLLFLNDDIEITDARWLHELLRHAVRPEVGTVGGLLLYPNGAIQHAGVFIVNFGGGCAHLFHKMMPDEKIYRRLDRTVREVTASTGACLMLSREKFEAVGCFDEELAVVGNDIDLCLRLSALGYRNIWTPQCCLIHHESISRKARVPQADEKAMWKRWSIKFSEGDNYYNPNLTLEKWDCSLRLDMPAEELLADLQFDAPCEGQNRQLTLSPGVNLIGYIRAEMGVGEGARSDARALNAAA
ncbi:MAG: glycosyltransferase family 2 protein, partial [Proteobacteria bacterium]|nr:glycosyltransferase family 2 protein [Pseudomonadota bacterium]